MSSAPSNPSNSPPPGSRKKKRVTFDLEAEIHLYESPEPPSKRRHHLYHWPASTYDTTVNLDTLVVSSSGEDTAEDTTTDWDVHQPSAEETDPEQQLNEEGIPLEPFNLHEERQHGYFDKESGGFVWFNSRKVEDGIEDAWADELLGLVVRNAIQAHGNDQNHFREKEEKEEKEMSRYEVDAMKNNVASMLLSGETVLDAIKRLGKERCGNATKLDTGGDNSARELKLNGKLRLEYDRKHPLLPSADNSMQALTDMSGALMRAGVYHIYTMRKEDAEVDVGVGVEMEGSGRQQQQQQSLQKEEKPDDYENSIDRVHNNSTSKTNKDGDKEEELCDIDMFASE